MIRRGFLFIVTKPYLGAGMIVSAFENTLTPTFSSNRAFASILLLTSSLEKVGVVFKELFELRS